MKRAIALIALAALVVPAMAGVATPTQTSTPATMMGSQRGTPIYADLVTAASYLNTGTTATYPLPVGDDIHAISGGTITSFQMGYYIPAGGTTGNILVNFFANDAVDSIVPPWPAGSPAPIASYLIGVQPGAWIVTITGVSVPVGQDFWFEEDWSNAYGQSTAIATGGPLLTKNAGGTVGYSHSIYSQTGSTWGLTGAWADFVLSFSVVPEPATIGLLAIGGLLALRRR